MTDHDTTGTERTGKRMRMRNVDHTHPYDDTSAGELFLRGPVVAADGGRREAGEPSDSGTMEDVDHTPPGDTSANPVFERGDEHDEGVDVGVPGDE